MNTRTPEPRELKAFLEGYQEAKKLSERAVTEALEKRRNVREYVADRLRAEYASWALKAERAGCPVDDGTMMPRSDQVFVALVLTAAFILICVRCYFSSILSE